MSVRRLHVLVLAAAGTLVGHALGYTLAHPSAAGRNVALAGHAYFGPLSAAIAPFVLVAVVALAVRSARRDGVAVTTRELIAAQVTIFSLQEVLERAVGEGAPVDVLTERGVWVGLAAQVAVAYVVARAVHRVARVLHGVLVSHRGLPLASPAARTLVAQHVPVPRLLARAQPHRGPPRQLAVV